jgi:hypothetical protein
MHCTTNDNKGVHPRINERSSPNTAGTGPTSDPRVVITKATQRGIRGLRVDADGTVRSFTLPYSIVYEQPFARWTDFFKARITVLSSVWGTGKTEAFCRFLAQLVYSRKTFLGFILVISSRIVLAPEMKNRFNNALANAEAAIRKYGGNPVPAERFVSYLDKDTPATDISYDCGLVICSLQSLHKLQKSPFYQYFTGPDAPPGFVFIDESEEIAKCMSVNETTGLHLLRDVETLVAMCKHPDTTITMCDACPAESTVTLADLLAGGDHAQITCIRNQWTLPVRDMIAHDSLPSLCRAIVRDVTADRAACARSGPFTVEVDGVRVTYRRHKFAVVSTNKRQACTIAGVLRSLGINVKLYTADTTQINRAWLREDVLSPDDCDGIVYSPVISVGVDFPALGLFFRTYDYTGFDGCPLRSNQQMLFRTRNPIDHSIPCHIGCANAVFAVPPPPGSDNYLDASTEEEEDLVLQIMPAAVIARIQARVGVFVAHRDRCVHPDDMRFHRYHPRDDAMSASEMLKAEGPTVRAVMVLDAIAHLELVIQRKHPREALFRILRQANIRLVKATDNVTPYRARKFSQAFNAVAAYARQVRMSETDSVKHKHFNERVSWHADIPTPARIALFRAVVSDRHSGMQAKIDGLTALTDIGFNRANWDPYSCVRLIRGMRETAPVHPLLDDNHMSKLLIVTNIRGLLGLQGYAPYTHETGPIELSADVNSNTETAMRDLLSERHVLFTDQEKRGPTKGPWPSTKGPATGAATPPTPDESDESDDEYLSTDDDGDDSDDEAIGTDATEIQTATSPDTTTSSTSTAETTASCSTASTAAETTTTATAGGPGQDPFKWTRLGTNILYSFTNTAAVWPEVGSERPVHLTFINRLPDPNIFEYGEARCWKLARPINLDGALITPVSKDETPLQLFDRALDMGNKLSDAIITALFGCTPDKIMDFAREQGWMQERTLGHAVNVGAYAARLKRELDQTRADCNCAIRKMDVHLRDSKHAAKVAMAERALEKQCVEEMEQQLKQEKALLSDAAVREQVLLTVATERENALRANAAVREQALRSDALEREKALRADAAEREQALMRELEITRKRMSELESAAAAKKQRTEPRNETGPAPTGRRSSGLSEIAKRKVVEYLSEHKGAARIDYSDLCAFAGVPLDLKPVLMTFVRNAKAREDVLQ